MILNLRKMIPIQGGDAFDCGPEPAPSLPYAALVLNNCIDYEAGGRITVIFTTDKDSENPVHQLECSLLLKNKFSKKEYSVATFNNRDKFIGAFKSYADEYVK